MYFDCNYFITFRLVPSVAADMTLESEISTDVSYAESHHHQPFSAAGVAVSYPVVYDLQSSQDGVYLPIFAGGFYQNPFRNFIQVPARNFFLQTQLVTVYITITICPYITFICTIIAGWSYALLKTGLRCNDDLFSIIFPF